MNLMDRFNVLMKGAVRNPLSIGSTLRYSYASQPMDYAKMVKEYRNWVYACVNKNAQTIALIDIELYRSSVGDEEPIKILKHPILDLFKQVNPVTNSYELKMALAIYLELTGNAYIYMARDGIKRVRELWTIPSHWTRIIPGSTDNFIDRYEVTVPGRPLPVVFTPDEIIHFKYPDPCSIYYGIGPLQASAHQVELTNDMNTFSIGVFKNNARPDGVLQSPTTLTQPVIDRFRENWNSTYKGTENAGKIAVLEAGLTYQQISISPRDLDFIEGKKQVRTEICAIFGVPASKLGIVEDVNRANAETNDYTYQKDTIAPKLRMIEQKLNEVLIPLFGLGMEVKFADNVPKDMEFKLRERIESLKAGIITINEARAEIGKDPVEGGDVVLVPFSVTPLEQAIAEPEPQPDTNPNANEDAQLPQGDEDEDEKKVNPIIQKSKRSRQRWRYFVSRTTPLERQMGRIYKSFFAEQEREVMANVNRFKSKVTPRPETFDFIGFQFDKNVERIKEMTTSLIEDTYRVGVAIGYGDLGIEVEHDSMFPKFRDIVAQVINDTSKNINITNRKGLIDAVSRGLDEGETMSEIGQRVQEFYNGRISSGALTTARTVVNQVANKGQLDAYRDADIEKMEWVSSNDDHVRDSHQAVNGEIINIGEKFSNGLSFPGDPNGPPEEVINCRCTTVAAIEKGYKDILKDAELAKIISLRQEMEGAIHES